MQGKPFAVSKFTNPSGEIVYRLYGWDQGQCIRKNFTTRAEAEAERQARELARLTDAQLQEAEGAFTLVKDKPQPLLLYVDFALKNYRAPEHEKPLTDAVAAYLAKKQEDHDRTLLYPRQLKSITYELGVLKRHFKTGPVSQCTAQNLTTYLNRGKPCLKTYNNRRGLISTFFKFCLQNDWVIINAVEKTLHHRINPRRGSAVTITAERAAEVMHFVETFAGGKQVPSFALSLLAGIRPCVRFGEITKLKLESVRLDTGVIRIEPDVSKVRMPRNVTIQPNLAAWLRAYPLEKFAIVPVNTMNLR